MQDQPIIFVTGGTGHLGYALLPTLLAAGYRVRALRASLSVTLGSPSWARG